LNHTMSSGSDLAKGRSAKTFTQYSNKLDFATGTRYSKAESTLRSVMALAGLAVHPLKDGDYLVCVHGYTHLTENLDGLHDFAVGVGLL